MATNETPCTGTVEVQRDEGEGNGAGPGVTRR